MEYSEEECSNTILWISGVMRELIDKDLVTGEALAISPRGIAMYDQLRASGFKANLELVKQCLVDLELIQNIGEADAFIKLIVLHESEKENPGIEM